MTNHAQDQYAMLEKHIEETYTGLMICGIPMNSLDRSLSGARKAITHELALLMKAEADKARLETLEECKRVCIQWGQSRFLEMVNRMIEEVGGD